MDVNVDGAFYTARESLSDLRDGAGRWCSSVASPGSIPGRSTPSRRDEVVAPWLRT